jgi:hypothetical protein
MRQKVEKIRTFPLPGLVEAYQAATSLPVGEGVNSNVSSPSPLTAKSGQNEGANRGVRTRCLHTSQLWGKVR